MSKNIQIALVSKETLPVFYIINEFRPNEVFLVGTEETTLYWNRLNARRRRWAPCVTDL